MLNTSGASNVPSWASVASQDSEETQMELSANVNPTLPLLDVVLKLIQPAMSLPKS